MEAVYAFTGVAPFRHDFENVRFDTKEFDARLGTPGLHDVRPLVAGIERKTILPPGSLGALGTLQHLAHAGIQHPGNGDRRRGERAKLG